MPKVSTPDFVALVEMCRNANAKRVNGTDLSIELTKSSATEPLLTASAAGGWNSTIFENGAITTKPIHKFNDGCDLVVCVHGIARQKSVVANNTGFLLRYLSGKFTTSRPEQFYLIDEDYASWENAVHPDVLTYFRALRITSLIEKLADIVRDKGPCSEAVILASRKLTIPLSYESDVLVNTAGDATIDEFEEEVFAEQNGESRRDIAKRTLIRFFESTEEENRLREIMRRLPEVLQSFRADFDIFNSQFSFDKAREEFERKKLDFIVKTNAASTDVMNKLIAIPVGQGLLASQMKRGADGYGINGALLAGSIVFAVIAAMCIANQTLTIRQIQQDLRDEKKVLQERSAPTYERLKGMISALDNRLSFHKYVVPIALAALILVTTVMTVMAYNTSESSTPQLSSPATR